MSLLFFVKFYCLQKYCVKHGFDMTRFESSIRVFVFSTCDFVVLKKHFAASFVRRIILMLKMDEKLEWN